MSYAISYVMSFNFTLCRSRKSKGMLVSLLEFLKLNFVCDVVYYIAYESDVVYDVVCDVVCDVVYDIVYFPDIISRLCNGGGGRLWTGYACPTLSQVLDHSFLVRTPFCVTASPSHNTCNTPCRSHPDLLFTAVSTPFSVQSASAAPS